MKRSVRQIGHHVCNTDKWGSVEAEVEQRKEETSVANAETGKDDFFIAGSSVGSRPGDWRFF